MEIRCPYCDYPIVVTGIRAGHFTPRCPRCTDKFDLSVADESHAEVRPLSAAEKLATSAPAPSTATAAPAVGATMPPPNRTTARPTGTASPRANPPQATALPRSTAIPLASSPVSEQSRFGTSSRPQVTTPPPSAPASRATVTAPPPSSVASAAPPAPSMPAADFSQSSSSGTSTPADPAPPAVLGGYAITGKLGQGGMGSVYQAKQLSLDRSVALKVLSPGLAADASLVARFTREAYAAALMSHHNVVQVYDIGEDQGVYFYSMEYVEGDSLAGVLKRDGQLAPETAVGFTLQAARGLKFAHDHGLVHRDVKPANLLVNNQGIVKVADLGLVKKRGISDIRKGGMGKLERVQSANETGFDMSMGTPAYMSPEQARDATGVDARADVYSLGCTLYDLLTGHPPFTGHTAMEVITKHASQPITPPDLVSKRVPSDLSAMLMRMVAKRPDDRYFDMAACISAMEEFLGVESSGPFTPREQHASALESASKAFRNDGLAKVRRILVPGFFWACLAVAIGAAVLGDSVSGRVAWAGAFVGLAVMTGASYVVMAGVTGRGAVFAKARQFAFGASPFDWIKAILLVVAVALLVVAFNLQWVWITVALASVGLAAAMHFGLEPVLNDRRKPLLTKTEEMLRTMRFKGLDEDTIRQFVCKYAGLHWEEFYEALFGYDAKMQARKRWGTGLRGMPRPKYAPWRDVVIAWVDGRLERRTVERQQAVLAKAEAKKLAQVEGKDEATARAEARRQAQKVVNKAARIKQSMDDGSVLEEPPPTVEGRRRRYVTEPDRRAVAATAAPTIATTVEPQRSRRPTGVWFDDLPDAHEDALPGYRHKSWRQRRHGEPIDVLLGSTVRLPLAAVLLCVFLIWFHKEKPNFAHVASRAASSIIGDAHDALSGTNRVDGTSDGLTDAERSLAQSGYRTVVWLPGVPEPARRALSGYPVGIAGAVLLFSCLYVGRGVGLLSIVAAAVIIVGRYALHDPVLGYAPVTLAECAGGVLCLAGIIFGRE